MPSHALCAVIDELEREKKRTNRIGGGAAREERRSGDRTALALFYRAFG